MENNPEQCIQSDPTDDLTTTLKPNNPSTAIVSKEIENKSLIPSKHTTLTTIVKNSKEDEKLIEINELEGMEESSNNILLNMKHDEKIVEKKKERNELLNFSETENHLNISVSDENIIKQEDTRLMKQQLSDKEESFKLETKNNCSEKEINQDNDDISIILNEKSLPKKIEATDQMKLKEHVVVVDRILIRDHGRDSIVELTWSTNKALCGRKDFSIEISEEKFKIVRHPSSNRKTIWIRVKMLQELSESVAKYFQLFVNINKKTVIFGSYHTEDMMCDEQIHLFLHELTRSSSYDQLKECFKFVLQFEVHQLRMTRNENIWPMGKSHLERLKLTFYITFRLLGMSDMPSGSTRYNTNYVNFLENLIKTVADYEMDLKPKFQMMRRDKNYLKENTCLYYVGQILFDQIVQDLNAENKWDRMKSSTIGNLVSLLYHIMKGIDFNYDIQGRRGKLIMFIMDVLLRSCVSLINKPVSGRFKSNLDKIFLLLVNTIQSTLECEQKEAVIRTIYGILRTLFKSLIPKAHIVWGKCSNEPSLKFPQYLMKLLEGCFNKRLFGKFDETLALQIKKEIMVYVFDQFGLMDIILKFIPIEDLLRYLKENLELWNCKELKAHFSDRFQLFVKMYKSELDLLFEEYFNPQSRTMVESLELMYSNMWRYIDGVTMIREALTTDFNEIGSDNFKENEEPLLGNWNEMEFGREKDVELNEFYCDDAPETRTSFKIRSMVNGFQPVEVRSGRILPITNKKSILRKTRTEFRIRSESLPHKSTVEFRDKLYVKVLDGE
ncbi:hypothetical protein SNEBB_002558, partial [Seison nebaliae]